MKAEYPASVICYRAKFDDFQKSSSGRIRNLPAEINDDFAVLASVGQNGSIGFDKSKKGAAAIKSLISNCYYIDINGELQSPSSKELHYMPFFMFRDKDGRFERAVNAHRRYELDVKKHEILSRHRSVEKPRPPALTVFLQSDEFSISQETYKLFKSSCQYVAIAKISGEYGHGAFDVFSSDLNYFFDEFFSITGESADLIMVDNPTELPRY
ncbi:hypothetical protein [Pseudomonas crudilactis]|jgi:hypothetical protein|uniref:hypothetical protein n=1 Tax=Pseudomonas crudilactis TaxID=2697028 RepID=UPI0015DB04DB|nr:hypothetical protein [Pseudomonas crudilactis]